MKCQNCGKKNKKTNIICQSCSTPLINKREFNQDSITIDSNIKDISKNKIGCLSRILTLIFIVPFLLVGIFFLSIGLFFSISERMKTIDYEKTTAFLKDYTNCTHDENGEFCEAIYEFEVNETIYSVSPNSLSNREDYNKTETVYYNPNDPNECLIYANWSVLAIAGLIFIIVTIAIYISRTNTINRILNYKDEIQMNNYKKIK